MAYGGFWEPRRRADLPVPNCPPFLLIGSQLIAPWPKARELSPNGTQTCRRADTARAIGALEAAIAGFRERAEADTATIAGLHAEAAALRAQLAAAEQAAEQARRQAQEARDAADDRERAERAAWPLWRRLREALARR